MNFQNLAPVPTASALLDAAFSRARQKLAQLPKSRWNQQQQRQQLARRIDVIQDVIRRRLEKILQEFPKENELSPFYLALLKITVEYPRYKQAFGAVHWAARQIDKLRRTIARQLPKLSSSRTQPLLRHFYGRVSSFLKQINPALLYLEQCRQIFRTYPDVKEMFTICIYGFPNVGKTTLLNALTGTKAKVADYAFTTTSINAGYCTINDTKIQVLDVPGSLARPEKMNLIEQQAELVLQKLAEVVVFVFDVSGQYPLAVQQQLLAKVQERKTVIVYVSRQQVKQQEVSWRPFSLPPLSVPVTTSLSHLRLTLQQFLLAPP